LLTILLWWSAPWIAAFMGKDFSNASKVLEYLLPVLFFGCMNYILGFVGLVNLGLQRYFFYSIYTSGTIAILFLLLFVQHIGIEAAAISMSLSECILFVLCIFKLLHFYKAKGLHYSHE